MNNSVLVKRQIDSDCILLTLLFTFIETMLQLCSIQGLKLKPRRMRDSYCTHIFLPVSCTHYLFIYSLIIHVVTLGMTGMFSSISFQCELSAIYISCLMEWEAPTVRQIPPALRFRLVCIVISPREWPSTSLFDEFFIWQTRYRNSKQISKSLTVHYCS